MRARCAIVLLLCAGCGDSATTLLVHMDARSGLTVEQLSIKVVLGTGGQVSRVLASSNAAKMLPGSALVILPDISTAVEVTLSAVDDVGGTVVADGIVQSQPHQQRELSLTLGVTPGPDGGGDGDGGGGGDSGGGRDGSGPPEDLAPLVPTTLSIVAGLNGGPGRADGIGDSARINIPEAILLIGNTAYFTEQTGLRKFDITTNQVSSIALSDSSGPYYLNNAEGLAWDGTTLYVSSMGEDVILKVALSGNTGTVTLLAGMSYTESSVDGVGAAAGFRFPQGLALDGMGGLWVADTGNALIRKIDLASATVYTVAGTAGMSGWVDMPGSAARFKRPNGLTFFNNKLYISDGQSGASGNGAIRELTPSPSPAPVITVVGTPGTPSSLSDGPVATAGFGNPAGILFDGSLMWVVDTNRNNVRNVTLGGNVSTIFGDPQANGGSIDANGKQARFVDPRFIAIGSGQAWVTDDDDETIRGLNLVSPFPVTTVVGRSPHYGQADAIGMNARFTLPAAVVAGGADFVYVSETSNQTIRKVTIPDGVVSTVAGGDNLPPSTDGQGTDSSFATPSGIAIDNSGNLYVSDAATSLLRMVTFSGGVATVSTVAGTKNSTGNVDGVGPAARFDTPLGLAFDGDHTVFIADSDQYTIRSYDTVTRMVTTLAGQATIYGGKNGPGLMAHFANPLGLAYDKGGQKLYVSEENCDVRVITFNPVTVARVAGQFGTCGQADGTLTAATFQRPEGMVLGPGGSTLWVADRDAGTVRKLDLVTQMVTTPIGTPLQQVTLPGPLPAAVNTPVGLALLPAGLVISSFNENVILLAH